jgi:hypothetical protein
VHNSKDLLCLCIIARICSVCAYYVVVAVFVFGSFLYSNMPFDMGILCSSAMDGLVVKSLISNNETDTTDVGTLCSSGMGGTVVRLANI